jgi:chorismate mutase / prephenate dehydratase
MAGSKKRTTLSDAAVPGAKPLQPNLEAVRARIDAVDEKIHSFINERARLARQVGISKAAGGRAVDFYRPEREAQVLRRARARNSGPLRDEEVLRLFREIMSACLAQQEPLKVAFLGPEGTFTQTAVLNHFGHSVRALPLASIDEVFHEVESASADFGVVPIENSTEGTVNHTLDRFLSSPLKICGEVELRIRQHLMGAMNSLGRIVRVCSHPQSLAQCREWLDEHLPNIEQVAVSSNAEGARRARDEKGTAAIAGETAAEVYGLKLLAAQIEDRADNTTRFLVLGRKLFAPSGEDRTTLLVSVLHTDAPGALYRLLEPLAKHRVSLTRIESRPSRRRKWDYVFFIDFEGHAADKHIAAALVALKKRASLFRILGSYPRAVQ